MDRPDVEVMLKRFFGRILVRGVVAAVVSCF